MTSLQQVNLRVRRIRTSPQRDLQKLAAHIHYQITQGVGLHKAFQQVHDVSSGDPRKTGIKPISFVCQVLAGCLHPELLQYQSLPVDVRQRARTLLESCDGGSVGEKDFGCKQIMVKLLASGEGKIQTGVLTPLPCPHNLPMVLDEGGVRLVPYRLREDGGWAVNLEELQLAVETAWDSCQPRALYISNPGNPTGHVQDRRSIEEVIKFAATESLFLLVDEVYQDSVFGEGIEFVSYKRVLFEMGLPYSNTVQLASFHCLSNGIMGECGLRGGYMELINIDPPVMLFVETMLCTDISTPITGQLALELMVNPPKPGDPSYDTYKQEVVSHQATLCQNAKQAWEFLNSLPGVTCQPVMGGVYVYPRLSLPPGIKEQARAVGMDAGVLYCQMLLEQEGLFVGAGCEHSQGEDNYHLRLCVLAPTDTLEEVLARLRSFHLRLLDRFPHPDTQAKDMLVPVGGNNLCPPVQPDQNRHPKSQ